MPPHWLPYAALPPEQGRRNTHGVRAWAAGQVASFHAGLLQLARRAESDRWPEFADMSCLACHHSLENSRWRRERGFQIRAGLPPWSPARWAVLRQLVGKLSGEDFARLDAMVQELATNVAYLNRPRETAAVARALADELEPLLARTERTSWSRDDVYQLLRAISSDTEYLARTDIQSAEQALLAVNSLVSYLAERDRTVLDGELARLVELLDQELTNRFTFTWPRFNGYLAQIADNLQ